MVVRYPELSELVGTLTRDRAGEITHQQVHAHIVARGWVLGPERGDHYVNELLASCARMAAAKNVWWTACFQRHCIDSCERFKLLRRKLTMPNWCTFVMT